MSPLLAAAKTFGGTTPLKNSASPGERPRRRLFDIAKCSLQQLRRLTRQGEDRRQSESGERAEDSRRSADDHNPQYRATGDPARLRGLGALGDADDEQRDDQRDNGHLERVQPQGADKRCDAQRIAACRFTQLACQDAGNEAQDQRGERVISAEIRGAAAGGGFARTFRQRGFLNRKMKRSVLPLIAGSCTSTCECRRGSATDRCSRRKRTLRA